MAWHNVQHSHCLLRGLFLVCTKIMFQNCFAFAASLHLYILNFVSAARNSVLTKFTVWTLLFVLITFLHSIYYLLQHHSSCSVLMMLQALPGPQSLTYPSGLIFCWDSLNLFMLVYWLSLLDFPLMLKLLFLISNILSFVSLDWLLFLIFPPRLSLQFNTFTSFVLFLILVIFSSLSLLQPYWSF